MSGNASRFFIHCMLLALAIGCTGVVNAQRPGGRPRVVVEALDLDHDGDLSAEEIKRAATSLRSLDRDGDGQLSMDELTPRRQDVGVSPDQLASQLMQFDKNGDGVLTPEELPQRMQALFARADANKDGKLTPEEIRQSAAKTAAPRGRPSDPTEAVAMMHLDPVAEVLDSDNDGIISAEEITAASTRLLVLDKNHDGAVTAEEMTVRQQSPAQRTTHVLGEFDTNHDGKLSRDEVPDGLRGRFADADTNGDGFLDKAELEQMFASTPVEQPRRNRDGNGESNAPQQKGPNN